jgi:hypothetical protein
MGSIAIGPTEMTIILVPLITFAIVMGVLVVFPFWVILSRLGFAGALSLLMLVPALNIVLLFYLAFSRWPEFEAMSRRKADDKAAGSGHGSHADLAST